MRRRWLNLCTVWPSHSQISLWTAILSLGKAGSRREPNLGCWGGWQTWVMWCITQKFRMRAVEWAGVLSWWSCSEFGKLSQRRLTAYWRAPRESECTRVSSKVSSDWLPGYKVTRSLLEMLKMDGYFSDSPRIWSSKHVSCLENLSSCCHNAEDSGRLGCCAGVDCWEGNNGSKDQGAFILSLSWYWAQNSGENSSVIGWKWRKQIERNN